MLFFANLMAVPNYLRALVILEKIKLNFTHASLFFFFLMSDGGPWTSNNLKLWQPIKNCLLLSS